MATERALVNDCLGHLRRSGVYIANFEYISHIFLVFLLLTLREKSPNTEFFLVRIFLYSD